MTNDMERKCIKCGRMVHIEDDSLCGTWADSWHKFDNVLPKAINVPAKEMATGSENSLHAAVESKLDSKESEVWEVNTRKFLSQFLNRNCTTKDCEGCKYDLEGVMDHIRKLLSEERERAAKIVDEYRELYEPVFGDAEQKLVTDLKVTASRIRSNK